MCPSRSPATNCTATAKTTSDALSDTAAPSATADAAEVQGTLSTTASLSLAYANSLNRDLGDVRGGNDDDDASVAQSVGTSVLSPLSALDGSSTTTTTIRRRSVRKIPTEAVPENDRDDNDNDDDDRAAVRVQAVVWGTDVYVPTAVTDFRDFLRTFVSVRISRRRN